MISDRTIEVIQESTKPELITTPDGRTFATRNEVYNLPDPPKRPTADALTFRTLAGLVDYLNADPDKLVEPLVHITKHNTVVVTSPLFGDRRQRETVAIAEFDLKKFEFGQWMTVEDFNIGLQALFVETEDRARVLKLVGNVTESEVMTLVDDGVTQRVEARVGIANVDYADVPRIVQLAPFRTFADIDQPVSPFLLRLKKSKDGNPPVCALFEADGGRWKLDACQSIAYYLAENLTKKETPIFK